jgi:hypothetical protein
VLTIEGPPPITKCPDNIDEDAAACVFGGVIQVTAIRHQVNVKGVLTINAINRHRTSAGPLLDRSFEASRAVDIVSRSTIGTPNAGYN